MSMTDNRPSIVLVHGVGAERSGHFLDSYLVRRSETTSGETFSRAAFEKSNPFKSAVEVFWGDSTGFRSQSTSWITRPALVFGFVLRFMLALAQVCSNGWDRSTSGASRPSKPAVALKYFLFSVALPSPIAFVMPLHYVLHDGAIKYLLMISAALPSLAICYYLRKDDLACKIGLWVGIVLLPTVPLAVALIGGGADDWARYSARCVGFVQVGACALVVLALIDIARSAARAGFRAPKVVGAGWTAAVNPYLLKIFGVTFPFAVLGGGFGALGWAINLAASLKLGGNEVKFKGWSKVYQEELPYDLALMEAVFAVVLFAVGLLVTLLVLGFFVALCFCHCISSAPRLGRTFRKGLCVVFIVYAILTFIFIGIFIANLYTKSVLELTEPGPILATFRDLFFSWMFQAMRWFGVTFSLEAGAGKLNVFQIYGASAFRLLSFVPMLAPGVIVFVATAADVVFWLVRPGNGTAPGIAQECRKRFVDCYESLTRDGGRVAIVVAYSQGSVIAIDTLATIGGREKILTIGSPINSLYNEFLGIQIGNDRSTASRWTNIHRRSDYIGGAIAWAGTDVELINNFELNHLDYFVEPMVQEIISQAADQA